MRAVMAGAIAVVAVIAALARGGQAAAFAPAPAPPTAIQAPSPVLTLTGVAAGLPGAVVAYAYQWPGHTCATADIVTLVWDDPAKTAIANKHVVTTLSCTTTLTGQVPGNASPGAHFPTASVQTRASSGARASSAFTVVGPPTAAPTVAPTATPTPSPTPSPTPAPTPTDTPAPTDTPSGAATPTSATTPGAADVLPLTPTSGGTSGLGGIAVVGVVVLVIIAAAVGATVLLRRRRERLRGQDPFEFLR
jgi:hypothetical protein